MFYDFLRVYEQKFCSPYDLSLSQNPSIMVHQFYANLTIGTLDLSPQQYKSIKTILFDSFSAMAFVKIPNQWVFSIKASSREEAKETITKKIAQIIATIGLKELTFTLSLSIENLGIGTMRNKQIFPKKNIPEA